MKRRTLLAAAVTAPLTSQAAIRLEHCSPRGELRSGHECDDCGLVFPGLSFWIPDEAWNAIMGGPSGLLCLWCCSKRLEAAGLQVRAELHLVLPGLSSSNPRVLEEFERLDMEAARR